MSDPTPNPEDTGTPEPRTPPVDRLLTLGEEAAWTRPWPDYLAGGLGEEHVPELVRMATDPALNHADSDSAEVWAPVHAWRALGQLRAGAAAEPLTGLMAELEESDWALEELPMVLGMIGQPAIPALSRLLADSEEDVWARVAAAHALQEIGEKHEDAREEAVALLTAELEKWYRNDGTLNGFLVSYLVDLGATGAAPVMEQAFAEERVDLSILGDWEDAQVRLGLLPERLTPRPRFSLLSALELPEPRPAPARHPKSGAKAKEKSRRKMARQSRKKNRRR